VKAKILLVHNQYGSAAPSGENQVVDVEYELLLKNGHEVHKYYRYSDEIVDKGTWGSVIGAFSTPWNPFSAKAVQQTVDELLPEVVNVHNTFPLLSPAIFHSIASRAARVLTLHNYRLFCSAAIPMRDGKVCTECIDRHSVWPALRYGCYRNSRIATLPLAFSVALHRNLGTWIHHVDAFIAGTEFQRLLMIEAGLPAELVHVKPNFYPGNPAILPWKERRPSAVFAGRLTAEKGVESLLRAWMNWGTSAPELRILGEGELKEGLMKLVSTVPGTPIRFLGHLSTAEAQEEIARSRLLILPSEWFEAFPMVIREAFAFGTPVAVSDIGPLPSIVCQGENGVVFSPGDPESLLKVVRSTWNTEGELERLAAGARQAYETLYTEEVNYKLLMDIYQQAIEVSERRKSA
jgi:glycosyltransferase involved in cell wall biosynthesis